MPRTETNPQARYWIATIPYEQWSVPETLVDPICWLYGQQEISNETNYHHWQFIVATKRKIRLRALKNLLGGTAHLEPTRSESAEVYVRKDDTAVPGSQFEKGEKLMRMNSKTDWKKIKDLALSGNLNEIADNHPNVFISCYRTLKQISIDYQECPDDLVETCGIWVYGDPGVGKSYAVRQKFRDSLYVKPQNKWWDGYNGEEHVLMDDFDSNVMGHFLKIWSDCYGYMAESKSTTSRKIRPKTFIITSNYRIEELFNTDPVLCAAIQRRFKFVHMTSREDANLI